jgi:hypothetical protein
MSPEQAVGLLLTGSTLGSGLFWTGVTFGRLLTRVERIEGRSLDAERHLGDHDDELRMLKGLTPRA